MAAVKARIAETLTRRGGKIQGKASSEEDKAAYLRAVAERKVKQSRIKKPELTGKPRSWKQVCDNERTVNIGQYTRKGTRDGKLTDVTIAAHCRNPMRK
jgi:hypothetical protein